MSESKIPAAVFFDFDGVICDSVDVKTQAFDHLYRDQSDEVRVAVRAYHLEHGGISRYEKIRHYETLINGVEPDQQVVDEKADQFANLVVEAVIESAYVVGAEEALASLHDICPLFVVSGTPQGELRQIVDRRGLNRFFSGVYGAPAKKADILRNIMAERGITPENSFMIGDAMTDYNAARDVGMPFVGIVGCSDSPFPEGTIELPDLRRITAVILSN